MYKWIKRKKLNESYKWMYKYFILISMDGQSEKQVKKGRNWSQPVSSRSCNFSYHKTF